MRKHTKADLRTAIHNGTLSLFFVLFLLLGCTGQKKVAQDSVMAKKTDSLALLLEDNYSGSESEELLVVRNAKELQMFFAKINRTRKPGIPVPTIDFSQEMVVIFCAGALKAEKRPLISICEERPDSIFICPELREKPNAQTAGVSVSPFSVYKIPMTKKKIIFKKTR